MKIFKRSCVALAALAVSATVLLSGCSEEVSSSVDVDSVSVAPSTASSAASSAGAAAALPSGATAAQTSELLSSLTSEELQALVSGTTTLAQLEKQRFNLPDTAASTDTAAAGASSAAASASSQAGASASSSYDAELQALLDQLYSVRSRAEGELNGVIASAKSEYHALPKDQQTQTKKVAIVMGKANQLRKLQAAYDSEVSGIVSQMRTLLKANGQSTDLADQAQAAYEAQKSATYNSLKSQLFG